MEQLSYNCTAVTYPRTPFEQIFIVFMTLVSVLFIFRFFAENDTS